MEEIDLADDAVRTRRSATVDVEFARGAQHALMWAYHLADEPPVPY